MRWSSQVGGGGGGEGSSPGVSTLSAVLDQQLSVACELVGNAESQGAPQTSRIRLYILFKAIRRSVLCTLSLEEC